jgi:signal transduction histidine kinase
MLKMILNNLLENAIKFSPLAASIQLELLLEEDSFAIQIRDQGPGFSPADQQGLFQKFGRLSARPTAGESSHGLGLFIVRRLVEALDGQIQVTTLTPSGSLFEVRFKRQRQLH